jgi:hypothetical protein
VFTVGDKVYWTESGAPRNGRLLAIEQFEGSVVAYGRIMPSMRRYRERKARETSINLIECSKEPPPDVVHEAGPWAFASKWPP